MSLDLPIPHRELTDDSPEFLSEPPHFSHPRIPEDLRVPWGLVDLVVFVLVALTATFMIGLLVFGVFVAFGMPVDAIRQSGRDQGLIGVIAQVLIDLSLLGYLALQVRVKFREPFWTTIGWRPLEMGVIPRWVQCAAFVLLGATISFFVNIASDWHAPKGPLPIESVLQDPLTALLFMIVSVTLAPLFEETLFRGYIYPAIGRSWGTAAGILITGALFGGLHSFQLWPGYWQIALMIVVGIIFTWVRAGTKTVVASYFLHIGYNGFLFAGLLLSTHFLRSMPTP